MLKGIILLVAIGVIGVIARFGYLEDQKGRYGFADSTQQESSSSESSNDDDSLNSQSADSANDASSQAEKVTEAAADKLSEAKDASSDVAESATDKLDQSAEKVGDMADSASESMEAKADAASESMEAEAETASDSVATEVSNIASPSASLSGLSREIGNAIGSTTSLLSSVSDEASAKSALPKLTDISAGLNGVTQRVSNVPDAAKAPLAKMISGGIDKIKPLAEKATSIPGVGDILQPVMGPMLETLAGLGQ